LKRLFSVRKKTDPRISGTTNIYLAVFSQAEIAPSALWQNKD